MHDEYLNNNIDDLAGCEDDNIAELIHDPRARTSGVPGENIAIQRLHFVLTAFYQKAEHGV